MSDDTEQNSTVAGTLSAMKTFMNHAPSSVVPTTLLGREIMKQENKEIDFSIILNARKRLELFKGLLQSIVDNTDNLNRIEMLVAVDDDDDELVSFSKIANYPFQIHWIIQPRPESLNESLNMLARKTKGNIIWNLNNDCLLDEKTKSWDTKVLEAIKEYKEKNRFNDGVYYIGLGCSSVDHLKDVQYASFPMVSKEAFEVLNMFMDSNFRGLEADNSLAKIYLAVSRCIWLPNLVIRHILHESVFNIIYAPDEVTKSMRERSRVGGLTAANYDVTPQIKKLQDYINSKNN